MSLVNHYASYTDLVLQALNDDPRLPPFPRFDGDLKRLWREWITRGWFEWEAEGYPWWGNLHHAASYWPHRGLENVLLVHYADLKADLPAEVARIASFLGIELPDGEAARVARACHIDRMREAALEQAPRLAAFFAGGARSFFFQGTNGRWQGVLDADDLALYDSARARLLEPECARWLERGLRG